MLRRDVLTIASPLEMAVGASTSLVSSSPANKSQQGKAPKNWKANYALSMRKLIRKVGRSSTQNKIVATQQGMRALQPRKKVVPASPVAVGRQVKEGTLTGQVGRDGRVVIKDSAACEGEEEEEVLVDTDDED